MDNDKDSGPYKRHILSDVRGLRCCFKMLNVPRDPCTQILPALGPKVCKYYLHWAIWIPRVLFSFSAGFRFEDKGLRV